MLLRHASESLAALCQGIETGRVGLGPASEDEDLPADPARAFGDRACQLLDAWTSPGDQRQVIEITGCPLAAGVMAAAAALEVAVHGWDISRACGQRQPIARTLAIDLLAMAPVLVSRAGRHPLSRRRSPCRQQPAPATSSLPSSGELPGHNTANRVVTGRPARDRLFQLGSHARSAIFPVFQA
jgi:hypothetical protein